MNTSPVSSQSSTATTAAIGTSSAAEQQDRFMKLLVAQMRNQDPLNPMDNAEMTSQIAQINTVGGIEKLNQTVESLLASFNLLQAQGATQLPGRDVLVKGTSLTLNGGTAAAGVELVGHADAVNVDIVNAGGVVVRSIALGSSEAGVRSFAWDGRTTAGQQADPGRYALRVTATAAGQPIATVPLVSARVQSVANGSKGVQVDLGSAGVIAYSDIKSFL